MQIPHTYLVELVQQSMNVSTLRLALLSSHGLPETGMIAEAMHRTHNGCL